jgi:hypothetical protein
LKVSTNKRRRKNGEKIWETNAKQKAKRKQTKKKQKIPNIREKRKQCASFVMHS